MDPADPKKARPFNSYLKYSGLGLQLLGGIGISAWVGHALDVHLNLGFPAFLLSFVLLAFGGMMFQVYRSMKND